MKANPLTAALIGWGCLMEAAAADDWPTYGHDNRRSHVTEESLSLPLEESWVYRSAGPPQTAWTGPAKWDAFASNEGLQSMRNFDPVFFVTVAGDKVFFGSSADNAAHCLDAVTGVEQWVAFAGSAVRLPPTIDDGRVYFGADDGFAYCVDAINGKEQWRFRPVDEPRMIPSNGKLISRWPVRTGVMIEGGLAYFAGSLFPWESSYLCAVDAASGEKHFVEKQSGITLQGALLASAERLFAPQGRSVPLVYAKATGSPLGSIGGSGGVYCILTEEEQLISMPDSQKARDEVVKVTDTNRRQLILSINGANRMLIAGGKVFCHQRTQLKAIDRPAAVKAYGEVVARESRIKSLSKELSKLKKVKPGSGEAALLEKEIARINSEIPHWQAAREAAVIWSLPQAIPSALILAGDHLFLGGDGIISGVSVQTGEEDWTAKVEGRVYGLAVANGRLFASTDRGHITCFTASR